MFENELYRAEQAAARAEMEPWVLDRYRPMNEISGWDSEDEEWINADAEIDLAYELQNEFGKRYKKRMIDEVAGQLVFESGDWGRAELAD